MLSRMQQTVEVHTSQLARLETLNSVANSRMDSVLNDAQKLGRDIAAVELRKCDRQEQRVQYAEMKTTCNKLLNEMCLKENHIATIENFVEKYLPLRVMSQLHDTLSYVWKDMPDGEPLRKL